jgi:hypothetical protein
VEDTVAVGAVELVDRHLRWLSSTGSAPQF